MNPRIDPGFLNTGANLLADLTLVAYLFLIVPALIVGFIFARRRMYEPHHKYTMTAITIVNWLLILFVMGVSYSEYVRPEVPDNLGQTFVLFPTLHLITGGIAQLLATYLVIRMWFENVLPGWVKVRNIKLYMRTTLALWLVTAFLGVVIYLTWYTGGTPADEDTPAPVVVTEEAPDPVVTEEAEDGE